METVMNQSTDPIVSDRFLRERYGVSPSTTWRLRKREHNPLPHFYVGGQVRYSLAEVEKFFAENRERK